ncbi:MAG: hypothetical protein ACRDU8_03915 [Egibacteraceae bacterium]
MTHAFRRAVKREAYRRSNCTICHIRAPRCYICANPKVVSKRLGHSSVAFTLDTYAHVMPGMQPEAAALFMDLVHAAALDEDEDEDKSQDGRKRRR